VTSIPTTIELPRADFAADPAQLAAIAFLARYSGRTLDAYRHDLRNLFQWAADHSLPVLEASRPHLEMYRSSMEERGLAASTIDRRLPPPAASTGSRTSTAEFRPTLLSTSAVPLCIPPSGEVSTEVSSVGSCSPPSDLITPTPRWPCYSG
jgi:integrase family protein with SAM-like domain